MMFFYILAALLAGIVIGTLTGVVPGIHPNTVFVFLLSAVVLLPLQPEIILVFIISVAVSNTFTDFLPSLIFGVPDPATALSVLPGHKLVLEGNAHEALFLTVVGGLGSIVLIILTLPLIFLVLPPLYGLISPFMHIILSGIIAWMVFGERNRGAALLVIALSGALGFVSLNAFSDAALFPAFTGLFALSTLFTSVKKEAKIPPQKKPSEVEGPFRKGIITGWLAGWFSGMLPGIGAAQAGVLAAQALKAKTRDFLTALGGINTSNIVFTLMMLYLLGRTRSGAAVAVSQIVDFMGPSRLVLIIITVLVAGCVSAYVTLFLGKRFISVVERIDYVKMNQAIIIALVVMVAVFSSLEGIIIAFAATCIGIITINSGVRRSHLMGFLLIPTILYFSSVGVYMKVLVGM
jgi:putative membrane protein